MLNIKLVAPKIYALEGDSSEEVAAVMIRIQENYESPHFRNKVFTLKEFIPWYMASRGKDTLNLPITDFPMKGKFNPLRAEEQWLVDEITRLNIKDKFYLLGYDRNDQRVIKHEIAHGLFYTNRRYKRDVLKALKGVYENHPKVVEELSAHGYCDEVLIDEFHAWTLTDSQWLKHKGVWTEELDKLKEILETVFEKHTTPKKPRKQRSDKGKPRFHCSVNGWCEIHGEHGP